MRPVSRAPRTATPRAPPVWREALKTPDARPTRWGASALLADGQSAEQLHRTAIDALGQSRVAAHLARARLGYGEWLRRENRRVDARVQLHQAYDIFVTMGASGFADRARRELLAGGEEVLVSAETTPAMS